MHALPPTNEAYAPEPMEPRVFLSRSDVERLLEDKSPDSRIEVVKKISVQYSNAIFTDQEMMYAEQIFRLLMRDTELRVRHELARSLQHAKIAPRDVIVSLASDHERVALPIIESSEILSDADLIRIIDNSHAVGKIEAVARRSKVSGRVSHALVETHYPQVVKTLLGNAGATIEGRDYDAIIEEYQRDAGVTQALAARPNLPLPVVEKMIHHASEELAAELKRTYNIEVEEVRRQSQESMLMQILSHKSSDDDISETVNQMHSFARLTPSMLVSALCHGHIRFFEIGLAKLAGIPKANARKLVRDKGAYGFEALYEKAQMPASLFEAVHLLLGAVLTLEHNPEIEPGSKLYLGMVINHMTTQAQGRPVENLAYLTELVRRAMED